MKLLSIMVFTSILIIFS